LAENRRKHKKNPLMLPSLKTFYESLLHTNNISFKAKLKWLWESTLTGVFFK